MIPPIAPCGLPVDLLRNCYRSTSRMCRDSGDSTDVTWYFVDKSLPWSIPPTTFGSVEWEGEFDDGERTVGRGPNMLGEQVPPTGSFRHYNGRDVWGAPAERFCGTADQWANGISLPPDPPVDLGPEGIPQCCFRVPINRRKVSGTATGVATAAARVYFRMRRSDLATAAGLELGTATAARSVSGESLAVGLEAGLATRERHATDTALAAAIATNSGTFPYDVTDTATADASEAATANTALVRSDTAQAIATEAGTANTAYIAAGTATAVATADALRTVHYVAADTALAKALGTGTSSSSFFNKARVAQLVLEVAATGDPSGRVAQVVLEVSATGAPDGRVAQVVLEVALPGP